MFSRDFVSWASNTLSGCWWLDLEPQLAVCFEQQEDCAAYVLCWSEPALHIAPSRNAASNYVAGRDAAAYYCPYVPLMSNGLVIDPNTLAPIGLGPKD